MFLLPCSATWRGGLGEAMCYTRLLPCSHAACLLERYFTRLLSGSLPNLCVASIYLARGATISGSPKNVSRARGTCSPWLRSPLWLRLRQSQGCCRGETGTCFRWFLISPKSQSPGLSLSPARAVDQVRHQVFASPSPAESESSSSRGICAQAAQSCKSLPASKSSQINRRSA